MARRTTFQNGEKVICVDPSWLAGVEKESTYTVLSSYFDQRGIEFVKVDGKYPNVECYSHKFVRADIGMPDTRDYLQKLTELS